MSILMNATIGMNNLELVKDREIDSIYININDIYGSDEITFMEDDIDTLISFLESCKKRIAEEYL